MAKNMEATMVYWARNWDITLRGVLRVNRGTNYIGIYWLIPYYEPVRLQHAQGVGCQFFQRAEAS